MCVGLIIQQEKKFLKTWHLKRKKIQTIQYNETYFISRIAKLDGKC